MKLGSAQMDLIIGDSPSMKTLETQIDTAARSDLTVLITGESGTGKELVAQSIHRNSTRSDRPFVCFNCGAITESLLESELFGYVRGSFTGANRDRKGLFEAANSGTLFLDEIGEMSVSCQVKLLRVLQERAVRPVGGLLEIPVDVRVVAATNRNLAQEISLGRFRQDLFYRIAVLTIHTPALRQRPQDVPLLVQFFLSDINSQGDTLLEPKIDADAMVELASYTWPGNVRQLRHVIERLMVSLNGESRITLKSVKQVLNELSSFDPLSEVPHGFRENDSLDDFMARTLLGLYNHYLAVTGNHSEVARIFRTNRNTLYERVARARERLQAVGIAKAHVTS